MISPVTNSSCSYAGTDIKRRARSAVTFVCKAICADIRTITIPNHQSLRLGTLNAILSDVANYLNIQRAQLEQELFPK